MPNTGARQNPNANRSGNQHPLDKISSLLQQVKKETTDKDTGGKFYGFVLYANKITVSRFNRVFRNNKDFRLEVLRTGGEIESEPNGHFLELFVEVPELSDFFPRPDLKMIQQIINNKDILIQKLGPLSMLHETDIAISAMTTQTSQTKNSQNIQRSLNEIKKTMNIITMYPRVYKYCKKNESYPINTACELEFPYDNKMGFPSMGYGYFRGPIGGIRKIQGIGLDDSIKKIIEEAKNDT